MKQYKTVNNLVGWLTFLIAAVTYCLTIEPSASFWDCPEFITTGYKLEVGHPSGAPFFMLTANLFTQFTSDPTQVAKMVNYMSALMSATCILFLFWSITHLVRRLLIRGDDQPMTTAQMVTIIGSGMVGALAYTFSDTFWFSAVEGEVYAFSSLFTALVFWLILKWEDVADQPHSDRWLILIAYLTGLSIGVHLLNLLCLPAIVLVYYYRKNPDANLKGSVLALIGSAALVAIVLYGIVPGVIKVGGVFELFFVNTLSLPFNTGVMVYIFVIAAVIIWGVYESYVEKNNTRMNVSFLLTVAVLGIPFYGHGTRSLLIGVAVLVVLGAYLFARKIDKKYKISARTLNTAMLSILVIMIGYSTYALIVIRSVANTPMDQNSPEDIFTLGDYLGREQYGTRPLFYGQAFSSRVALERQGNYCEPGTKGETFKYIRKEKESANEKDSYIRIPGCTEYIYAQNMLFPRMYSSLHAAQYQNWVEIKGKDVPYDQCGEIILVNVPTQWENIQFFFRYQLNFMYWRYFLWNFVGRQNDIQNHNGEFENGNWITGFNFIDNLLVGNQEFLPTELKENKGHNVFYGLPLLLGILGLLWQSMRGQRGVQQFWVVFFLFFMTGIAIVLYLNQTPGQPRERDYAYAGSFYAFAIWIGMGVAALVHFINQYLKGKELPVAIACFVICLLVPIQMVSQTWDDHDRSHRYLARDTGWNYLQTLPEKGKPVIFTNGDNDTFPLWYNQETEGVRTDARTCNLSYLQTDWYIDQMKRPAYDSPALPITWDRIEYVEGTHEYVSIRPELKKQINELYAQADSNPNPEARINIQNEFGENPYELQNILKHWVRNESLQVIPTDSMVLKVDKEAVIRSGMVMPGDSIPEYMHISLKGKRVLYKSELMMLEMLANANWERPLFMAITVGSENHLNLGKHFIQEGLGYRITPFNSDETGVTMDTEKTYDNLMNRYRYGGLEHEGIYLDETNMRMCATHRRVFSQLVGNLLDEEKDEMALKALDYSEKVIPAYNVPHDFQHGSLTLGEGYYQLDQMQKGDEIVGYLANKSVEYLIWYLSLDDYRILISSNDITYNLSLLAQYVRVMEMYGSDLTEHYSGKLDELYNLYVSWTQRAR